MKTLLIIDDDPIVVESLKMITENAGYEVLATGKNSQEAIALYKKHQPDLVLMDIRMGDENGIQATKAILESFPQAKILLVTTFEDDQFIKDALQYGARGYILKQNIHSLLPAMEAILSGHTVLDETIIQNVQAAVRSNSSDFLSVPLSERELEIYQGVAEGLNNKEIAEQLFLSEGTVRNYVSILLEKFEVRDRTQLAIRYYKNTDH